MPFFDIGGSRQTGNFNYMVGRLAVVILRVSPAVNLTVIWES